MRHDIYLYTHINIYGYMFLSTCVSEQLPDIPPKIEVSTGLKRLISPK